MTTSNKKSRNKIFEQMESPGDRHGRPVGSATFMSFHRETAGVLC